MTDSCCPQNSATPGTPQLRPPSRRTVLGALGGLGVLAAATPTAAVAASGRRNAPKVPSRGLSVVLLGTKGGPPPSRDRTGIASAVVVDGATYLVDAGRAAVTQYVEAGLTWSSLRSVFVTHLHADHVADLFQVYLLGGFQSPLQGDSLAGPIPTYGPGQAGGLPATFGGGSSPTTNPDNPTPGLAGLIDYASNAFAYSTNLFMRDSRIRETRSLADVREIQVPIGGASFQNTAPIMDPFVVAEDDRVRVSAVLVPHGPTFPAFAYRFDTDHGSVTFSGDTTYSENLVTLAKRSDLLVHEAINVRGWDGPAAVVDHLLQGHVEVQEVGPIAQRADVDRMVLSHVGDLASPQGIDTRQWRRWAQRGYDGRVWVGEDREVIRIR